MPETNGRWKFAPPIALSIAGAILAFGVAYGTLMHGVGELAKDIGEIKALLKENYYTRSEVTAMRDAAEKEHALLRQRIEALERGRR